MSETSTETPTYSDDRNGMMRVHIASQRSRLAGERYTRDHLRAVAKAKGLRLGSLGKHDLGWEMAQRGLIDADGRLRDGFPEVVTSTATEPRR